MVYFQLAVYFLVMRWIQDSVAQRGYFSISASPDTTVSTGEEYTITCQSRYYMFGFKRNNIWTIIMSNEKCNILPPNEATDYECVLTIAKDHVVKLKVLGGESSPQTVQWSCAHLIDDRDKSRTLNIIVRNPGASTTTSRIQSTRPSLVSSTNTVNKQAQDCNTILIAIGCVGVVLVLFNTAILLTVLMAVYNRRKQDRAKQGTSGPFALKPRGIPAEGNYNDLDKTMDDRHTYGDDGHYYDTSQVVPESSKLNLRSSRPLALKPRGIPAEGNYDDLDKTMDDRHTYGDDGHYYDTSQVVPDSSNLN